PPSETQPSGIPGFFLSAIRNTASYYPSPVGTGAAAVGAGPVCFFGREEFLPADRAGLHLGRFPVFRLRMLNPPLSPAGSRAEFPWPAGLVPCHGFPALRAEPFRYMG